MYSSLTILIAQTDSRLESFSGGFRKNRAQIDSGDVVLILIGFFAVFIILWLVSRWSERRVRRDSSLGLFWTLAKAHSISWGDRWLLWRIARAKRMAEPALLFLDPRLTSPQCMHHLAAQSAARLKALRRQFFFGIDRAAEAPADTPDVDAARPSADPTPTISKSEIPSQQAPPIAPTGDLAEALGAMQTLNLRHQPVQEQEPPGETDPEEKKAPPAPPAEFPDHNAPAIDLYPWLGNDWEITNTDE